MHKKKMRIMEIGEEGEKYTHRCDSLEGPPLCSNEREPLILRECGGLEWRGAPPLSLPRLESNIPVESDAY